MNTTSRRIQHALAVRSDDTILDPIERIIADLFCQVLRVDHVGREDSFFELGGDSVRLMLLQLELRRSLGREVPISDVFEHSSVSGIARSIGNTGLHRSLDSKVLVPVRESGSLPPLFVVHANYVQAFVSPSFLRALNIDQPVYAFQARGLMEGDRPHTRIGPMAAEYLAAMMQVQPDGPYFLCGICGGSVVAQEMACMLDDLGKKIGLLLLIDPGEPFSGRSWLTRLKGVSRAFMVRSPWKPPGTRQLIERIVCGLNHRASIGKISTVNLDSSRIDRAVRASADFRIALNLHRSRMYSGPAFVVGSEARVGRATWQPAWRKALGGPMDKAIVAEKHDDVLDPHNTRFGPELQRCVDAALNGLRSTV